MGGGEGGEGGVCEGFEEVGVDGVRDVRDVVYCAYFWILSLTKVRPSSWQRTDPDILDTR